MFRVFYVASTDSRLRFRNPHCALCHPDGTSSHGLEEAQIVAPLSILLNVGASISDPKVHTDLPSILISRPPLEHNLKTQLSNCTSNTPKWHSSAVLMYITFTGTLLSVISLCCLHYIYLCFKELRNLPGKCLISLCVALLFYQAIFLGTAKSREVASLCKAVAIFLHLFLLAAFSGMSVLAFDTVSTFTVKG